MGWLCNFLFTAATNNDDNVNDSAKFSCEFLIGARNANESIRHGLFPLQLPALSLNSQGLQAKKKCITAASAKHDTLSFLFASTKIRDDTSMRCWSDARHYYKNLKLLFKPK